MHGKDVAFRAEMPICVLQMIVGRLLMVFLPSTASEIGDKGKELFYEFCVLHLYCLNIIC